MSHFRFLLAAARVVAAMALAILVIKIAPTLAGAAAGHAGTYAAPAAAAGHAAAYPAPAADGRGSHALTSRSLQ
ncbi:MAG: hypothetical protein ABI624_16205 [Casimicrobiaceae bacterium]